MKSGILSALLGCGLLSAAPASPDFKLSGPYTHDNLTIFLIHAPSTQAGKQYVTLKDAMEAKKVFVYETGNVTSLAVENVSSDSVFIQGGDIVKGGQQDRVIPNDFLLPPKSGRLPVSAFCVEPGRWSQRGAESVKSFSVSSAILPSQGLKKAAIVDHDQRKVWDEVAKEGAALSLTEQMGLSAKADRFDRTDGTHLDAGVGAGTIGSAAGSVASPSSLQLMLESKPVREASEPYVAALTKAVRWTADIVGFASMVNGEVQSVDVYASPTLFTALWPKLLRSSAIEAGRLRRKSEFPPGKAGDIETLLYLTQDGPTFVIDVRNNVKLIRYETPTQIMIESREGDSLIHRSYLKK